MKYTFTLLLLFSSITFYAQTFVRSQLPTQLNTPWEMTYGPDGMLWITEDSGVISRVDPVSGFKTIVYQAPDYFGGDTIKERLQRCHMPDIGHGTLGMDLHPNFLEEESAYIYFFYSYNAGTAEEPNTLFKLARIKWDWTTGTVTDTADLVTGFSNGYDHWGGRLKVLMRDKGQPYIFLTIGDHGISERNSPDCYENQSENPNNFTQIPANDNGKVHRFNMDGSIPIDNPIPGNSFYTRGHRNPQGLMYIPHLDLLYDIEHGDRTDDEVNLLEAGMNYGWRWVRGYHSDNNYPGEAEFIQNYTPHPEIEGDRLIPAFYSFCAEPQPESDEYLEWCTPAPSDGIYYNYDAIPELKHSLLVTSLKNGTNTDNEVHVLRLMPDGRSLVPSTQSNPNPRTLFSQDQAQNGRLRDIAISPDGRQIFLINNGGEGIPDHISVYTAEITSTKPELNTTALQLYPNPAHDILQLRTAEDIMAADVYDLSGNHVQSFQNPGTEISVTDLPEGVYVVKVQHASGQLFINKFVKQ
jgi:glucose/arabinose dehydrogenase